MKDSGIEWIGEIPEEWTLTKIGSVYDERNTKVSDQDYQPLSVTKQGVVPQLETAAKTDNGDNRKLIKKNDFVINSRSDRRGSCGISELDGSCSLINTVLKPRNDMCNRYYGYVFKSDMFADEYYRWGHGIVNDLWSTKWSDMKSIYIPMPPIANQEHMASYLDSKCSKIDSIISKQEQIIEKLKEYKLSLITKTVTRGLNRDAVLADSGIEWLGKVPHEWEVHKLSDLCDKPITYGIVKMGEYDDENGVKALRCSDVQPGYINEDNIRTVTEELSKEYSRTILDGGEIVINVRGTLGGCAIVPNHMKGYNIAREIAMVSVKKANTRYVMYNLLSNTFKAYQDYSLRGVIYVGLNINLLNKYPVYLPSEKEQHQIVLYLDKKCDLIDTDIRNREKLIDRLNEYKKSLIYEVVTGKKEV